MASQPLPTSELHALHRFRERTRELVESDPFASDFFTRTEAAIRRREGKQFILAMPTRDGNGLVYATTKGPA